MSVPMLKFRFEYFQEKVPGGVLEKTRTKLTFLDEMKPV